MKAVKYTQDDINKIDLGTKVIYKYPTPTDLMDIGRMVVSGRHPVDDSKFIVEHKCNFIMYITSGKGKVYAGEEIFEVKSNDVVFVPKKNKFAVEGEMEYITFDTPAFNLGQSEEIANSDPKSHFDK